MSQMFSNSQQTSASNGVARMTQNASGRSADASKYKQPVISNSDITNQHLLEVLVSQKTASTFNCPAPTKKDILTPIVQNNTIICNKLSLVDMNNQNKTNCYGIYKNEFLITLGEEKAIKKLKKANNTQLSNLMIQFYNAFCIAKLNATFRAITQKEYYKRFMKMMERAVTHAKSIQKDKAETKPILQGLKLTKEQESRKYLQGGAFLPSDDAHRCCVFCKHNSVDEPPSNLTVVSRNEQKAIEDNEKMEAFKKFKNGTGPEVRNPKTGKVYKTKPQGSKMEALVLQCHCHEFHCAREGSDVGSTCPFRCIDLNGSRYPWIVDKGGCQCPACLCRCKKAYNKNDVSKIQINLDESNNERLLTAEGIRSKEIKDKEDAISFVNRAIESGRVVRASSEATYKKRLYDGE
jgi:hypothetical protein